MSIGKTAFSPYIQSLIEIMLNIQQQQLSDTDPQRMYLAAGWQRLSLLMEKDLIPYLNKIFPPLLKMASDVLDKEDN